MPRGLLPQVRACVRFLIEQRLLLSVGFAIAVGVVLQGQFAVSTNDPLLNLIAWERPAMYRGLVDSFEAFLFTTPFLVFSMLFSLAYVHFYRKDAEEVSGPLPPYPDVRSREELFLVLGEVHKRTTPRPSQNPSWLMVPARGLYTGMAIFGATGAGKTRGLVLPIFEQLFGWMAGDPERKLSGVVLEVKGDLCKHLRRILAACGREEDYIGISLESDFRYNPLHNSLDPYALAFNLGSIITAVWGKSKEPFWQQSYTDLCRYVILLHRIQDDYVTLRDVYRTTISPQQLEDLLISTGRRFNGFSYIAIAAEVYAVHAETLVGYGFALHVNFDAYLARHTPELERFLIEHTAIEALVYMPKPFMEEKRLHWESLDFWYWEHWKFFRHEVKSSIVQGVVILLSHFEVNLDVRRVFCPPKEFYQGKPVPADPQGKLLPPFEELIESGKVLGLELPVMFDPGLARTIGTMMKIDHQRAVLLRIPKMETAPEKHFRPTVFLCDEYQGFATVGGDSPIGDERFLSLSRQSNCIPIVATQSVSSIKEALPNAGCNTLFQAFRTQIFLTTMDEETARYASAMCGKVDKTRISYTVSESSTNANANVGWLSGRTSANKGSVSASKQYQKHKEPLFDTNIFRDLENCQSIVVAYDGLRPLPPTYCYLKLDFMPVWMTWFEQRKFGFDPERIRL